MLLPALVMAQSLGGSICGRVTTSDGKPAAQINITLKPTRMGTITNQEGEYQLVNVPVGTYTLTISGVGFATRSEQVAISDNAPVILNIQLAAQVEQLQTVEVTGRRETSYKNDNSFSAAKIELPIRETPQSISTITKELIQDRQSYRLQDVVQNVAGINQFSTYDDITMRGFRNSGSNGRLINGLRSYNNFWTSPLLVNIERVEVIKGPASATFSNTNPGGTVNMVTKKPLAEERKSVSFTTGSFNTFRATADFTGPLNDRQTLLYRLNLGYENAESFRNQMQYKTVVVAPSVSFLPRPGTRFNADLVYSGINTLLDRGRPIFQNDNSLLSTPITFNLSQPGDYLRQQNLALTLSFTQQLTDRITFNASYLKFRFDEQLNEHGFNRYITRDSIELYFTDRLTKFIGNNLTTYFTFDAETGPVRHTLLAGYDFVQGSNISYDSYAEGTAQGLPDFSLTRPVYYQRPVASYQFPAANYSSYGDKYDTQGLYVQDLIKWGRWQALLSLRQEFYRYPVADFTGVYNNAVTNEQKQTALLPRVGLVYALTPQLNAYATYATGFEPQEGATLSNPRTGGPFDPLTSELVEGGLKGEFFRKRLLSTFSVYQITQNNVLVSANDAGNPDRLLQRGQERARGFELEAAGKITSNLSVLINYANNDTRITRDTENDVNSLVGQVKENAPRHISGSWIKYVFGNGTLRGLGIAAGHSQVSKRNTFDANLKLPGYVVFNAAVYYQVEKFQLGLNLNNITDRTHWTGGYNYQRNFPGAPRNYLLTAAYTF